MIRKVFIFSGERPSNSARALRKDIPARRLKLSSFTSNRIIINWGCSNTIGQVSNLEKAHSVWNHPKYVLTAINKLEAFSQFSVRNIPTVPFTPSFYIAKEWLKDSDIIARHELCGHSGAGIEVIEKGGDNLPSAPLYTLYCPKKYEYRVHVMFSAVIDVTRKIRDPDQEPISWKIRSHQNGFIFSRSNLKHREEIEPLAIKAVSALHLEFGAVDIIIDENTKQALVLEVNTAPGLQGQTLENYVNGFQNRIAQT